MTDYASWKFGKVVYPLTESTSNSLLRDADPTIYYALDFFSSMITMHVGARLLAQAAIIGAPIPAAVAMTIGYDPAPFLEQSYFQFPLLAVYRKRGRLREKTGTWRHDEGELNVDYILPPLSAAEAEHILPILRSVGRVIDMRTEQGWDPTYTPPGGVLAGKVWSSAYANLEKIEVISESYAFDAIADKPFCAWRGTLAISERSDVVPGALGPFTGADGDLDYVDGDGTTVANIARIAT